ncbi:MAG: tRNA (adenosine(37)-N6)-threonylcarbamoyltransferase complex transferase subunit TsaD [Alistipes sp.]|jgi:N6-L-threonylcarbamoyladenine synthase|nr:tRNA (adenosine(37)-N6)-threonylcarbamoyltransferase complex transferase subunit TsaD [Alistipes sp.]
MGGETVILGIESSCDDTSAAVLRGSVLLSNVIASQQVHVRYGGVIPELASRAHQQNIVPVVDAALRDGGVTVADLDAIAFTRGPGLLGSLLVGVSFAKGLSLAHDVPLVEVNHLQGHILSHFIDTQQEGMDSEKFAVDRPCGSHHPSFPFICLLVSGGHTQIVVVRSPLEMEIVGTTIDDAAGEAFDKCAKVMGLPYPGGPEIDRLAAGGDPLRFKFAQPRVGGLDYSFSGLKTSFLYTLRDEVASDGDFVERNLADLCASLQRAIIDTLLHKLRLAARQYGVKDIAAAGGVSANSGLRDALLAEGARNGWRVFLPERRFTTDNAAMIASAGRFLYQAGRFSSLDAAPFTRGK